MECSQRATNVLWLTLATTLCAISLSAQTQHVPRPSLIGAIQRNDTTTLSRLIATGANPNEKDADGVPALMLATLFADAACVERLLNSGADPNQADSVGATALMWAVPNIGKVRVLLKHGANVNTRSSNLGRTALLIAAAYPGTSDLLELLLVQGADLHAKDAAGNSALAMAMQSADVGVLRFLTEKGLDPKDDVPETAASAMYTRARPDMVEFAASRGLKIPKDILVRSSNWQGPESIARWIDAGADVNARGGPYTASPLLTAASSELATADTLRVLLEHGADANAQDKEGEKALDWATYRADTAKIAVLEKFGATRGDGPRHQPVIPPNRNGIGNARVAVERSVSLLLKSSAPMFQTRRCFTCHHNTVPAEAAAIARRKGIHIDEELAKKNVSDILAVVQQAATPAMQAHSTVPGRTTMTAGYGLIALAAEAHPQDKVTAEVTHWMLASQMPDGRWLGNGVNRPPIEYSTISHTAITARALVLYPVAGRMQQLDQALAKARGYLMTAPTASAEDRAMRLLGLVWTKASDSAIKAARQEIVQRQNTAGSWSQLDQLDPDAYATGLSLVALHEAGMVVTDDTYRRGVRFLLTTQYADGSWFVRTRAFPVQPYFESGFPFGRHQWISAAGTAWAAHAVALTLRDAAGSGR